jgi:hypothetical protein
MKLFNIILNSKNYFQGNNTSNCNYNIDLNQLLDYDEKNYKKKYKLRFQLNSNTLSPSTSNLYGVYLYGLSNNIKNGVINNNTDYYHFLGILKPKLIKLMYMLEAKYNDNEPIILEGLNHTSTVGVQIKSLTSTPLTTLENGLIWWFKFQKEDFSGTSLYNHISKTFIANTLKNGATYSTINPKIGNTCLDLNQTTTAFITLPTINFSTTYANTPLTIAFWFKANTTASIYSPYGDYRDGRYFLFGSANIINLIVDNTPIETQYQFFYNNVVILTANYTGLGDTLNNSWVHLAFVFGNTSTFKLYLNGKLITTASNTQTITTNVTPNFGQNYSQSYLRGYANDMRFYARELSSNEVLSLYETAGIDYNMTLSLEEID